MQLLIVQNKGKMQCYLKLSIAVMNKIPLWLSSTNRMEMNDAF